MRTILWRLFLSLEATLFLTQCGSDKNCFNHLKDQRNTKCTEDEASDESLVLGLPTDPKTSSNSGKNQQQAALNAPIVSGETPTQNTQPQWNWVGTDSKKQKFRYRLDEGKWQETEDLAFIPSSVLLNGEHNLEVQEKDAQEAWSESGSFAILVVTQSVIDLEKFYTTTITNAPASYSFYESVPPVNSEILPLSTISLTFTDIIDPATISDSTFQVSVNGQVYGTISGEIINLSPVGSMISFTPIVPFPLNATVTITVNSGLKDNDGGSISGTSVFTYQTPAEQQQTIELAAISFEDDEFSGAEPWSFQGNGGIVGAIGGIAPSAGERMIVLTTGSSALISAEEALEGSVGGPQISSVALTIKRPAGSNFLLFDYDFVSSEFDEYVNSQYDDILSVSVSGSNGGSVTKALASVKMVGAADSDNVVFAAVVDPNPASALQHSGFQTPASTPTNNVCAGCVVPKLDLSDIKGDTVTITFTVSDIGDSAYDSAAIIDNIRFE